jgi:hypothetical protein
MGPTLNHTANMILIWGGTVLIQLCTKLKSDIIRHLKNDLLHRNLCVTWNINIIKMCGSAFLLIRSLLFWAVTKHSLVFSYRRFGTTYWSCLQGSSSQSVIDYQSVVYNVWRELRSHLHHGGSLKSCLVLLNSLNFVYVCDIPDRPAGLIIGFD